MQHLMLQMFCVTNHADTSNTSWFWCTRYVLQSVASILRYINEYYLRNSLVSYSDFWKINYLLCILEGPNAEKDQRSEKIKENNAGILRLRNYTDQYVSSQDINWVLDFKLYLRTYDSLKNIVEIVVVIFLS